MRNKFKILVTAAISILFINSCYEKNTSLTTLQINAANNIAYVKFINTYAASNPSTVSPSAGPSVNIFVNDVKINAAPLAYGGSFPLSPAYTGVAPGLAINIKVILNRTNNTPVAGDTISNKNYDLGVNSYTTFYIADTTPNPTPFNPFVVPIQELITDAPVNFYRARFVNMIPSNDTLEVFSKRLNAVIFNGQLYKNASPTVELPIPAVSDTFQLRKVSAPATVLATINTFLPTSSRTYTVYCTGHITGTPRARVLTSFTNR
ncbi:MAG: hypothetical protein JNM14_14765 [Ferruginibacter sp.]|nr:hypothetical protein [Ferruginibacter sp.]